MPKIGQKWAIHVWCNNVRWKSYCIVENFWGRRLSRIGENTIFTLPRIAQFCRTKGRHAPNKILRRKRIATKPRNSRKFSPSKVSCYTVHQSCTCMDGNIPQCHSEPPVLHIDICACAAPENLLEWSGAHWEDTVSKWGDPVAWIIHQLFSNQSSNLTAPLC